MKRGARQKSPRNLSFFTLSHAHLWPAVTICVARTNC